MQNKDSSIVVLQAQAGNHVNFAGCLQYKHFPWLLVLLPSVLGFMVLLTVIFVVIHCTRCKGKEDGEDTPENGYETPVQ
jgi:hypothetical protein